jgi:enamine deaminase RidA (YjgF/YER057c/UK114 family)
MSGTSPYESVIGFSRAVRVGDTLHVAGTGPAGAEAGDAATQTRRALEIIHQALLDGGATLSGVVRTRMFLTHVDDGEAVGRVHGEFFSKIRPAATMVVVRRTSQSSLAYRDRGRCHRSERPFAPSPKRVNDHVKTIDSQS